MAMTLLILFLHCLTIPFTESSSITKKCPIDGYFSESQSVMEITRKIFPARPVHANGGGAYGHFTLTHDMSSYSSSSICGKVGHKTKVLARFSTIAGEAGSADVPVHPPDIRGFSVKFYTNTGNWDLLALSRHVSPVRDPALFAKMGLSRDRNQSTHLADPNSWWDFQSSHPQTMMQSLQLFSNLAFQGSWRLMEGISPHAVKLVNAKGQGIYCKFHFIPQQQPDPSTPKTFTYEEALKLHPDHNKMDLYNAIAAGNFPSWKLYFQLMTFAQAKKCPFDPFDATKIWPESEYKLVEAGIMTLNKNSLNYRADIEVAAFSPSNVIPGLESSPDRIFQSRAFAYPLAQRMRLGQDFMDLPVNKWQGVKGKRKHFPKHYKVPKDVEWEGLEDDYEQPKEFYANMNRKEQHVLAKNIARWLRLANEKIRKKTLNNFGLVSSKLEKEITKAIENQDNWT